MLPEGWRCVHVEEVCDVMTGFAFPSNRFQDVPLDAVRLLRGDNVMQGYARWEDAKYWPSADANALARFSLQIGDVVLALDRPVTSAGMKCCVIAASDLPCLLVQRVARVRAKRGVNQHYLHHVLRTAAFEQHLVGNKTETAVPHVSPNDVRSFEFLLPGHETEQRRIANILAAWDKAISVARNLCTTLEGQRSVVGKQLTSSRNRCISAARWTSKPIADLIVESRNSGSGGHEAQKLTVKLYGKGVIAKTDKRPGSEATRYYRRSAGQFIYSKLDFLNGAFGIIPQALDGYESTLDLPAFDFLPGVDPQWFLYFVSREEFYQGHLGLANGGRKARRVNPNDLLRVRIEVPPLDEQRAIAAVIGTADAQVTGARKQVELLKQEKAALMADLLTGKRRVCLNREGVAA